jgi:hypothetical protein
MRADELLAGGEGVELDVGVGAGVPPACGVGTCESFGAGSIAAFEPALPPPPQPANNRYNAHAISDLHCRTR